MRRLSPFPFVFLLLAAQPAASTPPSPFTPGTIAAALLALAGAIGVAKVITWLWCDVCRPLLDSYVVRALRRERVNVEQFLRVDVFADDIAAADARERMTSEAITLAKAGAVSLELIQQVQREQAGSIDAIPRVADAVERLGGTLDRLDTTMQDVRVEIGRQAGVLEQMNRWDGETDRRHHERRGG